jgi:hypothetical protein
MMNMLPSFQLPSKMKLHNVAMLTNSFPIYLDIFVYPWRTLSSAGNNRAGKSGFSCVFWIRNRGATAGTIHGRFKSASGSIKRFSANLALKCLAVSAFKGALLAKFFGNIVRVATPTTILVAGASWFKFFFAMWTLFKFHVFHHSHCVVLVK